MPNSVLEGLERTVERLTGLSADEIRRRPLEQTPFIVDARSGKVVLPPYVISGDEANRQVDKALRS